MDYEDYVNPFKTRLDTLQHVNSFVAKTSKSVVSAQYSPNLYVLDDNISGIPYFGPKKRTGTFLTNDATQFFEHITPLDKKSLTT